LEKDMFVAQAVGRSMEPRISDGSYCIFRAFPVGTRQDKIVLARHRDIADSETGGDYTVKRYRSEKQQHPDGTWRHTKIILESLNPEFPHISLSQGEDNPVQIIAEFLDVLR